MHTTDGIEETIVVDKIISYSSCGPEYEPYAHTRMHLADGRELILRADVHEVNRKLRVSEE